MGGEGLVIVTLLCCTHVFMPHWEWQTAMAHNKTPLHANVSVPDGFTLSMCTSG